MFKEVWLQKLSGGLYWNILIERLGSEHWNLGRMDLQLSFRIVAIFRLFLFAKAHPNKWFYFMGHTFSGTIYLKVN